MNVSRLYGSGPMRPRAPQVLFVRTKRTQKGASPQGLDPLRFTGVFRTRSANEELRCPVNKNILRGSDLVVWRLSDSACRPLKGTEPAASGDPPNRCNANLHRTDVPQQGPPLGPVGRQAALASPGQSFGGTPNDGPAGGRRRAGTRVESIQLQQRANKQNMEYRPEGDIGGPGDSPGGFLVPFCPHKKVPGVRGRGGPGR